MIQIGDTIVSIDVTSARFKCDVSKCKGACCVHGDSGAPLEENEAQKLEEIYPKIIPYMREAGVSAIEKQGNVHMVDSDGDTVTVLVNNKECSFVYFDNGIAKCAIEKAYFDGVIDFRKPISCHLYPLRLKKYKDFTAVNYDQWAICKPAIEHGKETKTPLYVFLKDAVERKFGKEYYNQLAFISNELAKEEDVN